MHRSSCGWPRPVPLKGGAFHFLACYIRRMAKKTPLSPRERQATVQKVLAMQSEDQALPPNKRRTMRELAEDARREILKERA